MLSLEREKQSQREERHRDFIYISGAAALIEMSHKPTEAKTSLWQLVLRCIQSLLGPKIRLENVGMTLSLGNKSIAEGSYSNVLIGIDVNSLKKYAVKKMLIQSKEAESNIKNEVEAFNRFHHKNIIPYIGHTYQLKNNMRIIYMVFPLIQRGNLRQQLNNIIERKSKKLDLIHVLKSITAITEALSILHNYHPSYVHNDIKPENILISDDGQPLLTDFGSVRLADLYVSNRSDSIRIAEVSSQFCTPQYRPPELYDPPVSIQLDHRTDVWGIGCLLFAWYYGYAPFELTYNKAGQTIATECTYLRILSCNISYPTPLTEPDHTLKALVAYILVHDISNRPNTSQVLDKLEETINRLQHVYYDPARGKDTSISLHV